MEGRKLKVKPWIGRENAFVGTVAAAGARSKEEL